MSATRTRRDPERRMSLGAHLTELRKRFFRAAIGVLAGLIAGWFLYDPVWRGLQAPIAVVARAHNATINYPSITAAFDVHLQVALTIGLVISSPIWLYQLFAFLVPGLTGMEKRYTFGFFFSAVPLFLAGCAAGWFVMPHIVELMLNFVPSQDSSLINAKDYLDFVLKLVLVVGVAFVLPVFLVLLNFIGVLQGRTILKSWRWAILAITLFTATATPAADLISMFLLAVPMVVLYFVAVGVTLLHDRRVERRAASLTEQLAT